LRHGEIVGLTLDSVDLGSGFLKVRNSLTMLDELKGPKTKAGNRDVPMPVKVQQSVKEWLDTYYVPNERRLVFRMPDGRECTRGNFHLNYWRPLLRRAGLFDKKEIIHFHALRHFAASPMIELGLPLTDVASLLGHEKFDMTLQVYAHPIVGGNRRREAFERMASAIVCGRDNNATTTSNALIYNA
jgi:integrase